MFGRLTTRGKVSAALCAIAAVLALPKRVPCRVPTQRCEPELVGDRMCLLTDVEPYGVYLVELVVGRDLPIAYETRRACD